MKRYPTTDFYLAAFLLSQNYGLLACEKNRNGSTFVFEDSTNLRRSADKYFSRQATVEPMAFGVAFKSLKGLIHSTVSTCTLSTTQNFNVTQSQGFSA